MRRNGRRSAIFRPRQINSSPKHASVKVWQHGRQRTCLSLRPTRHDPADCRDDRQCRPLGHRPCWLDRPAAGRNDIRSGCHRYDQRQQQRACAECRSGADLLAPTIPFRSLATLQWMAPIRPISGNSAMSTAASRCIWAMMASDLLRRTPSSPPIWPSHAARSNGADLDHLDLTNGHWRFHPQRGNGFQRCWRRSQVDHKRRSRRHGGLFGSGTTPHRQGRQSFHLPGRRCRPS